MAICFFKENLLIPSTRHQLMTLHLLGIMRIHVGDKDSEKLRR